MAGMGAVAGSSKRVEAGELEEDADEACWNCRS